MVREDRERMTGLSRLNGLLILFGRAAKPYRSREQS